MKPLTPQQEKFARLVAEGKNQSDACQLAGIDLCDKPAKDGYYVYLLTNISHGTASRTPRDEVGEFLAHTWKIIRSIKPIDDWLASARDDQLALAAKHPGGLIGVYDEHIGELERIIKLQVGNFRSRGLTC